MKSNPLWIVALLAPGWASAASFLDYLREYDLNDYAVGAAISVSESPYVGGESSAFAYPYLTTFRHASMTDDWFLISEGDLGLRWVNDAGWELGVVGRVQTLGLGDSSSEALRGLDSRNWSVEIAPMVGFRRWPVQVNLKTYVEILGRHGGTQTDLTLRMPREYHWGFLVPSLIGIYRDADYTDYYFGVSEAEARPIRPAYTPGASASVQGRLQLGITLSPRWLLTAGAQIEFLGEAITDSPIVDQQHIWSANVGIAYNADIFQPHDAPTHNKFQPRFALRFAGFSVKSDASIVRDNANGEPGDDIDLENLLGVDDNNNVFQVDAIYRFNAFHRVELSYHQLSRAGMTVLENDIDFGDENFPAGTEVTTRVDTELLRIGYGFSLINDAQKELGVMAGLHLTGNRTDITAMPSGERESAEASTPLPVIGAFASVQTGRRSALSAKLQVFGLQFDRFEGSMLFANLEWQRQLGEHFGVGVGYNAYATRLRSREDETRGRLETLHHGPIIFVTTAF